MQRQTLNVLSTSTLTGNDVVNTQGENLGDIKDFVIDAETGDIAYAVLSFGGFLGIGDKLFAVPMGALDLDTSNERFVLDVSKDRLKDAPGFDKDNWPSTPERSFIDDVYTFYGQEPYSTWSQNRRRQREPEMALN